MSGIVTHGVIMPAGRRACRSSGASGRRLEAGMTSLDVCTLDPPRRPDLPTEIGASVTRSTLVPTRYQPREQEKFTGGVPV